PAAQSRRQPAQRRVRRGTRHVHGLGAALLPGLRPARTRRASARLAGPAGAAVDGRSVLGPRRGTLAPGATRCVECVRPTAALSWRAGESRFADRKPFPGNELRWTVARKGPVLWALAPDPPSLAMSDPAGQALPCTANRYENQ